MSLTINLPPEVEVRLREKAALEGRDAEATVVAVLIDALESEAQDRTAAIRGIQRGLDDFAAGRFRSFTEFADEQVRKYGLPADA